MIPKCLPYLLTLLSFPALANDTKTLLISPDPLLASWTTYASAREAQGTPIKVVTLSHISREYSGPDLQEKIRLCARHHIDQKGFTTIILGGDSTPTGGLIPDRDTIHQNMWGEDLDIPSDLFYISPTNWDADGDGIYGEFEDDREAISYPDGTLAIGRIPVRRPIDVENYTAKVAAHLAAETSPHLTFTCAVNNAEPKVTRSGKDLIQPLWPEGKVSFKFRKLTPESVGSAFSDGPCNKWHLHGHGLHDRWVLDRDEGFTLEDASALTNKARPLVITTVSCFTGHFDSAFDPSITEFLLRQKDSGAVLIVAPAREGKPHFHDPQADFALMVSEGKLDGTTQTMASFWMAALGEEKLPAGLALAKAKADLADDAEKSATYHQGICELNLLGDPTLPVR